MFDQQKAFIVTTGSYSDYRILRVFLDRDAAEKFAEAYKAANGSGWDAAEVEEHDVTQPGQALPVWAGLTTVLSLHTGEVVVTNKRTETDWDGRDTAGRVSTRRSHLNNQRTIYTRGERDRAMQAHSDAVAKDRAEILGL